MVAQEFSESLMMRARSLQTADPGARPAGVHVQCVCLMDQFSVEQRGTVFGGLGDRNPTFAVIWADMSLAD